jgi:hypothetical protein
MPTNYNKYGLTAIEATQRGSNPIESWSIVVDTFLESKSSRDKACPKNAFLGLCEAGLVKGIKADSYFKSKKPNVNKRYAITAVNILKRDQSVSKKELWIKVREELGLGDKRHNSQMDVVLALWEHGLIEK